MTSDGRQLPMEEDQAPPVDRALVAKSSRQTAVSQGLSQGVRLLTSIILARLLTPADFGIVAVALVATTVLDQLKDVGTASAIIQRKEVDRVLLDTVFVLNLTLGAVFAGILAILAGPVAAALGNADAASVIRVFAALMVVTAAGLVHQSLLRRTMRFRQIAIITIVQTLTTAAVSLGSAFVGLTYWSLVLGTVVGTVVGTVMLWFCHPWRPTWAFSFASLRSIWSFSWNLFLTNVIYILWSQADKVIVGRFAGGAALGSYTMAQRLVSTPLQTLYGVVGEVSFSAFARRQDDDAALRSGFTRSAAVVALLTFPMLGGIAAVAVPFVSVVLGAKWSEVAPVIVALAPAGAVQSVTFNSAQIFFAKGRADWAFRWGLVHLVLLVPLEIFGARWGVAGVAWAYAAGVTVIAPFTLLLTARLVSMRVRDYLRALAPFAVCTAAMVLAVLGVGLLTSGMGASDVVRLVVGVTTGVVTYGLLVWIWRPDGLTDALAAARGRAA